MSALSARDYERGWNDEEAAGPSRLRRKRLRLVTGNPASIPFSGKL